MDNTRPSKHDYYLTIAAAVSARSTCLSKQYGAVIVNDDEIVATGYNGAPRGRKNCCELGVCKRVNKNLEHGADYALSCRSVHAEMNAIISAARDEMIGSTMYLYGYDVKRGHVVDNIDCCPICRRLVINSGISKVYFYGISVPYAEVDVNYWVNADESLDSEDG